ncbi:MAG: hypothetical protein IH859_08170 [Chloroflexi bacterium]|nr:hypothetical protein [Chloroflexota bacterium]
MVFDYARQVTFLSNAENIGFGLLKTVKQLTQRLEVSVCPTKQWEKAILSGYKMFRELKKNKGGRLSIDMDEQEITYSNFVK